MKAWLNEMYWKLAVALGLIKQPPRMQPIPVRARREQERRAQR